VNTALLHYDVESYRNDVDPSTGIIADTRFPDFSRPGLNLRWIGRFQYEWDFDPEQYR